jgi:hypothetical protein
MKKLTLFCLSAAALSLTGCQNLSKTMFTHITIDNMQTAWLAQGNAFTNFCLSKNAVDRQVAFDFSTVTAAMLDLVVFNNDFYKSTYESTIAGLNSEHERNPAATPAGCRSFSDKLPSVTAQVTDTYRNYAQQLGAARSEEYQRLAQSMRNSQVPSTPMPQVVQPSFPNFNYTQEQSQSFNVLVNSKSGITQCRVTKNNFVFCL